MNKYKDFFVGGLINIGAGAIKAGVGAYQERQAKKKMAQADEIAEGAIRTQAARQRIAKQETDAQSAIDAALRAQATAAEQLEQSGGSRAVISATPGLVRATNLATSEAIEEFGTQGARVNQAIEDLEMQQMADRTRSNLDRLQLAGDAAATLKFSGFSDIAKGAAEVAGDTLFDGDVDDDDDDNENREEGGVQKNPLKEEVEKTPGEFSHDSNPIDIVQEGEKIGEMTGGEYIFNPDQAEKLLELSKEGDTELHIFVRNLLNQEQFK
tara:strand:- start:1584 stop:2387 length:804 start_codon:yes stop_codon:yes gene_type:complete